MSYCDNCGCKVYNGACTNCHEAVYIAAQYYELDMDMSEKFAKEVKDAHIDIARIQALKVIDRVKI